MEPGDIGSSRTSTSSARRLSQQAVARINERLTRGDETSLFAIAILVGLAMGLVSTAFRGLLIASHHFFQGGNEALFGLRQIVPDRFEMVVQAIMPGIGGLLVGGLVYKILRLRGGHGVPSVMKAVATGQVNLSPSMAIKSATAPITIASGGSSGPEGPIVEIGAVIGSMIGVRAGARKDQIGTLVGCGAAAGVAAVFNAPLGGVVFAMELIMRDFHMRKFSPIVVSAVIASVTSSALLPNNPAFERLGDGVLDTIVPSAPMLLQFGVLGLVCGLLGMLLVSAIYWSHDLWHAVKLPLWVKPALGGLLVGLIGLKTPGILGEGYSTVNDGILRVSLANAHVAELMLTLVLLCGLKVVATSLTVGSGGTGGAFAPAMFVGAFAGGAVGLAMEQIAPNFAPDFRIFALVGMAGTVASALGTPMAATLIIWEVSGGNYKLMLPLMIAVALSSTLTARMKKGSIYTLSLLRDGFDVEAESQTRRDPLRDIPVGDIMNSTFVSFRPHDSLNRIMEVLGETDADAFVVTNELGELRGIISTSDLRSVVHLGELGSAAVIAGDIADSNPPALVPDSPAHRALEIFTSSDVEGIPILERQGSRHVVGMIYRGAVLKAYRQAAAPAQ